MTIYCIICKKEIVKYKQDLGDTIMLASASGYICDKCAKEIAMKLIERSILE